MLFRIKRHPLAIEATFAHVLVLTYAFPAAVLRPLLPDGLVLDEYDGCGFVAVALVDTRQLRPKGWPAFLGQNFLLTGYRIFTRVYRRESALRGLYILRSDANKRRMVWEAT